MFRAKIINKQKKEKLIEFLNPSMKAGPEDQKKPFKDIVHDIKSIDTFEKRRMYEAQLANIDRKKLLRDSEAIEIFQNQLEDDLEEVIDQGFNKLDITNDGTIPLRTIK